MNELRWRFHPERHPLMMAVQSLIIILEAIKADPKPPSAMSVGDAEHAGAGVADDEGTGAAEGEGA
jgi:hypothetical protein